MQNIISMPKSEYGSLALTSLYIFFMCVCRKQVFAIICVNKGFIYHVLSPCVTILFWTYTAPRHFY